MNERIHHRGTESAENTLGEKVKRGRGEKEKYYGASTPFLFPF
jgi:hypothetical protein